MSDQDKPTTTQLESAAPRRRGCLGHLAKWWWAYLAAFVAIVILVVCLIIFVAIPKIAQSKLDEATLTIDGIVVTNTKSDSLTMAINSTIHTDGSVKANIDGFLGDMYLEDLLPHTPFAQISFPATTSDALQVVNVSQPLPITNMEAFTNFNTWLLHNTTLRVTVSGSTNIRVNGIAKSYPVTFLKTIEMPGLQSFNGTTVSETSISLQADDNGDNFHGFASIPNRSLVTFEIGNVSFNTFLEGEAVGPTYLDNVVLVPGAVNNFTMHANVTQPPVLAALGKKPYCENGGVLPFQLNGFQVLNHGQNLTYYGDALFTANTTILTPIGDDVKKILPTYNLTCSS
ncbi:hypothetical protein GQ53DRAFT_745281 [Thozetella sp. PMI_491]|nr:hypothetical protein GQ53DRAFT_745281 [Thozetella sp. PMI_491]